MRNEILISSFDLKKKEKKEKRISQATGWADCHIKTNMVSGSVPVIANMRSLTFYCQCVLQQGPDP